MPRRFVMCQFLGCWMPTNSRNWQLTSMKCPTKPTRLSSALAILAILGRRIRNTDALIRSRVARNPNVVADEKLSFGDRVADEVARFGGSWNFIGLFFIEMLVWIVLNTWVLTHPFDSAPYIGLNLILSMLAALQAPVIMMSQNRQDAKDGIRSELDFQVNLKSELEITDLHKKIDELRADFEDKLDEHGEPQKSGK